MSNEVILNLGSSTQDNQRLTNGSDDQVLTMDSGAPAWKASVSGSKAYLSFDVVGNTGSTTFGFIGQTVNINAFFDQKDNSGDFTVTGNNQINNISGRELVLIYAINFCGRATSGIGAKCIYSSTVNGSAQSDKSEGVLVNNVNDLTEISLSGTLTIPISGSVIFTTSNTTSTDPFVVENINGFLKEV